MSRRMVVAWHGETGAFLAHKAVGFRGKAISVVKVLCGMPRQSFGPDSTARVGEVEEALRANCYPCPACFADENWSDE